MDRAMFFELMLRRVFGDKAYQAAGQESDEKTRNAWLRKMGNKILREVDNLDTHPEHKKQLHLYSERFRACFGRGRPDHLMAIYSLLGLVATLLGFCSARGVRFTSPTYHRSADEYYTEVILKGGDPMQDYYDKKNAIELRREIIGHLKSRGIDDLHIALVLNTSEYEVKRLKK